MKKADIILKNCMIYDGSGRKPYNGEILIEGERIKEIAPSIEISGAMEIDLSGLITAPGFIDMHRHADLVPYNLSGYTSELEQGITTVVNGNCGFSPFPFAEESRAEVVAFAQPILGDFPEEAEWSDFFQYKDFMEKIPKSVNMATLLGNGTLRTAYNGFRAEWKHDDTFNRILWKLDEIQQQGVLGLSLGLMYYPECCYKEDELLKLAKCVKEYENTITVHLRGEGAKACDSIQEIIRIAEKSGTHFHISHLKAAGRDNWGKTLERMLEYLYQARRDGVFITWDAYPYDAGSTTLVTLLPPWMQQGGEKELMQRLRNPELRRKTSKELKEKHKNWDNLVVSTGWERVVILQSETPEYRGRSVAELASCRRIEPEEMCFEILLQDKGKTSIAFFHMWEKDVDKVILLKDTAIISDTLYSPNGYEHPRGSGTYGKFIHKYALKERKLSLEQAIRKCSALPAEYLGIRERGQIKEGNFADIIAFDPVVFTDKSTYQNPNGKSEGIMYVFINGVEAVSKGKVIRKDAGKYLIR